MCHLQWPPPVYLSTTYRPWHRLDVETFRQELRRLALCCSKIVPEDVDSMADLYNSELNAISDRLLPLRTSALQSRPSDPWFDDDCRNAKRHCRRVERRASQSSAAQTVWKSELSAYHHLIGRKRQAFGKTLVTEQQSKPRQIWWSIDKLLGDVDHRVATMSALGFPQFLWQESLRYPCVDFQHRASHLLTVSSRVSSRSHMTMSLQPCMLCRIYSALPTQFWRVFSKNVRVR